MPATTQGELRGQEGSAGPPGMMRQPPLLLAVAGGLWGSRGSWTQEQGPREKEQVAP